MSNDIKIAEKTHKFTTAGDSTDATCDNCGIGIGLFYDSPNFCPKTASNPTIPSDEELDKILSPFFPTDYWNDSSSELKTLKKNARVALAKVLHEAEVRAQTKLLERVEQEVIGEDEITYANYDDWHGKAKIARDKFRDKNRQALTKLRKEMGI